MINVGASIACCLNAWSNKGLKLMSSGGTQPCVLTLAVCTEITPLLLQSTGHMRWCSHSMEAVPTSHINHRRQMAIYDTRCLVRWETKVLFTFWAAQKCSCIKFVHNCGMIMTYSNTEIQSEMTITDTQAWMLNLFIQTEPRRTWGDIKWSHWCTCRRRDTKSQLDRRSPTAASE